MKLLPYVLPCRALCRQANTGTAIQKQGIRKGLYAKADSKRKPRRATPLRPIHYTDRTGVSSTVNTKLTST